MSQPDAPCRLFVYLARQTPVALVLRRGPSEWVRLSLWRTDRDTFEHGQWMKGRVYERRSDLSPDGSLFFAFVRQTGGFDVSPTRDSWLTVSRPPFFTALALWFIGGTWTPGGYFQSATSMWVSFDTLAPEVGVVPSWLTMRVGGRALPYVDRTLQSTERTVYFNRLLRDGWERLESDAYASMWQRRHASESRTLTMFERWESYSEYGGPYVIEYECRDDRSGAVTALGRATWADWDQQGRLVLARDGRLNVWTEEQGFVALYDFNGQAPDPQPSPIWAHEWPAAPSGDSRSE
jgi:hypothetical protein